MVPQTNHDTAPATDDLLAEDSLKAWWRYIHRIPLLTAQEEVELAKRVERGDEEAFRQMVEANLRLVGNIARKCRRFAGQSLTLADLVQEGNVGLIRAVKKFDYRKGYKFSTYASYWIRQAIMRAIAEQGRSIRLPVHMVESVSKASKAAAVLIQELGRPPSLTELALELGLSEDKTQEIIEKIPEPVSLDMPIGEEEDSVLVDFIEDKVGQSPLDAAQLSALRDEIERALSTLTEREQEILRLRYGLGYPRKICSDPDKHKCPICCALEDNDPDTSEGTGTNLPPIVPRTLDEVGTHFKLTRERIRQIEKMALKKLRRSQPLRETAAHVIRRPHSRRGRKRMSKR
ncbi:MAG: sigma-70 family RNA polymerase sigma factor [Abditibacteriales bacterium]|nr:sigma-70 family RNA polymerase sigma factor [Abditibacteriales bacterium]